VLLGVFFLMCLRHAKKNSLREVVCARHRQLRAEQTGVELGTKLLLLRSHDF
jgi:hypothetical protein